MSERRRNQKPPKAPRTILPSSLKKLVKRIYLSRLVEAIIDHATSLKPPDEPNVIPHQFNFDEKLVLGFLEKATTHHHHHHHHQSDDGGGEYFNLLKMRTMLLPYGSNSHEEHLAAFFNYLPSPIEGKRVFVLVRLRLLPFLAYLNIELANKIIADARSFVTDADNNYLGKFWSCCMCSDTFPDSLSRFEHIQDYHMESSDSLLRITRSWRSMIFNGTWKPIDNSAAIPLLQESSMAEFGVPETNRFKNVDDEDREDEEDNVYQNKAREYLLLQNWPLSNDSVRIALLADIQGLMCLLLSKQFLTPLHLNHLITYSMKELKAYLPSSLNLCLSATHLCICFLGPPQLRQILDFLQHIKETSEDKVEETLQCSPPYKNPKLTSKQSVTLEGDSLWIAIDENSFERLLTSDLYEDMVNREERLQSNMLAFAWWAYSGPSTNEHLELWSDLQINNQVIDRAIVMYRDCKHCNLQCKIEKRGENNDLEFTKQDAQIIQAIMELLDAERKINLSPSADYREFILPLVKSYLKALLEEGQKCVNQSKETKTESNFERRNRNKEMSNLFTPPTITSVKIRCDH